MCMMVNISVGVFSCLAPLNTLLVMLEYCLDRGNCGRSTRTIIFSFTSQLKKDGIFLHKNKKYGIFTVDYI